MKASLIFFYQGHQFYVEATCASPGIVDNYPNINATMKEIEFKVRPIPISEYKERLTGAIKTKLDKYNSSYKNNIEENTGFIIAISMAKIDFFNQPHLPNVDISCVFPCSENMTIPIYPDLKSNEHIGEPYHEYKENFKKRNSVDDVEIYTDYFSSNDYSYISAILISHDGHAFFPDADKHGIIRWGKCRNDFFLIRNPFADIPLPDNLFSVYRETTTKIEDDRFEINVKEHE